MDPNAALAAIRDLLRDLTDQLDSITAGEKVDESKVDSLIEHVKGLDQWLSQGGFLPDVWMQGRRERDGELGDGPPYVLVMTRESARFYSLGPDGVLQCTTQTVPALYGEGPQPDWEVGEAIVDLDAVATSALMALHYAAGS